MKANTQDFEANSAAKTDSEHTSCLLHVQEP